jgi:spore germination protein KA
MLRFLFMILGSTFGLYGISLGLIAMNLHLCSLRSFGIPYLSPLGPFIKRDQKDVVFRAPRHELNTRPSLIGQRNTHSQQSPLAAKPKPPK